MNINELTLANMSRDVYADPSEFKDNAFAPWWCGGEGILQPYQRSGTEAVLCGNDDVTIVAFRGTEPSSAIDVKNDGKVLFPRSVYGMGRVARGFHNAYMEISSNLSRDILESRAKRLYITGHSLGGALATICAAHMYSEGVRNITLCTFGSPAVGTRRFARRMTEKLGPHCVRYVNGPDPVPRVPLPGVILLPAYRHVGNWSYFTLGEDLVENAHHGDMTLDLVMNCGDACRPSWRHPWQLLQWHRGAVAVGSYHSMDEYARLVLKNTEWRRRNRIDMLIS